MSRRLDDLHPDMRAKAVELIARCVEAGIMVAIVDTLRTPEEQAEYVKKKVSWTLNSKHLTGRAIDLAPYETYALHDGDKLNWDGSDPIWKKIGLIGEAIGLEWGGRWVSTPDYGHFQLRG